LDLQELTVAVDGRQKRERSPHRDKRVLPRAQDAEQAECAGNRSRVEDDWSTDWIEPRSEFPEAASMRPNRATTSLAASVDPTEARSVAGFGPDDRAVRRWEPSPPFRSWSRPSGRSSSSTTSNG
jgi:hypothetical protein